jgi:EmrB/QacA subfamily drug resistance transporter
MLSPRTTALIVSSALFMEQLDSTVLATALPDMARSFSVDPLHMNVALTAYLLSLAVFIPISGKVADRFGTRPVFSWAIALFTLGSILCAQATSLKLLVAARLLQGMGGAMMVPVGRLVLLRTVAKSELVSAMAWLMVPATIGPVIGPPVGGFIVTYLNWRWIFYINVPVGVLGFVLVSLFIADIKERTPGPFDALGFVFSSIALGCVMFGLEFLSRGVGAAPTAWGLIVIGVISGGLYAWHAKGHPAPLLDFRLLRVRTFSLSIASGTLSRISVGAVPFLLPMMLQLGFGFTAAQSGLTTFALAIGSLLMKAGARFCLRLWGFRNTLIWVGLLATLTTGMCAGFRPSWPIALIYTVLVLGGFLQSLQFLAYNTLAYADIPRDKMSTATSFYTTCQQMAISLGIAAAAGALGAARALSGHVLPTLLDFSAAFVVVTCVSLLAPLVCLKLDRKAGAEMAGRP